MLNNIILRKHQARRPLGASIKQGVPHKKVLRKRRVSSNVHKKRKAHISVVLFIIISVFLEQTCDKLTQSH
jgi:hypothetical protein